MLIVLFKLGQNSTKPYGEHQDGSSIPLNATDTESVDSLGKKLKYNNRHELNDNPIKCFFFR